MIGIKFMVLFMGFQTCYCVPPIPAATTATVATIDRSDYSDNFIGELKQIKIGMKSLTEYLDKWNYMYISQLEPKIASTATTLASIDSNIRNLQERAHVWDTFQLHVAAWNEQLSTSDRKLDIISKAQEELMIMEGKINSFANVEYKIDKVLKKLENFEENISDLTKKIENSGQRDNLFGEFATRGILSTLKLIERKLDKIQLFNQNLNVKQSGKKNSDETKGKLTIKCNTSPVVEELLHDVASKVDIIFDKVSSIDNNVEELEQDDYLDDHNYEEVDDMKIGPDAKLNNKLWKKGNQPWIHTTKLLEHLIQEVQIVNNNTLTILKDEEVYLEHYRTCWLTNFKPYINGMFQNTVDKIGLELNISSNKQKDSIENLFSQQKIYFDDILKIYLKNECRTNHTQKINTSLIIIPFENHPPKSSNSVSCDDVHLSGLYRLGANLTGLNDYDTFYYTRYCEVREDGGWTVIQKRDNYENLQNFSLDWDNYKRGFGQLNADFWFGNDFIHQLSQEGNMILRIELEDFEGNTAWAEYQLFQIASENENYRLTIGDYRGNASDSLSSHNNSVFSTFDVKNDDAPDCCPCAESYGGGWWFNRCFESNLNGVYHRSPHSNEYFRGIIWEHWLGNYSLKKTMMLLKRKKANTHDHTEDITYNYYEFLEDP